MRTWRFAIAPGQYRHSRYGARFRRQENVDRVAAVMNGRTWHWSADSDNYATIVVDAVLCHPGIYTPDPDPDEERLCMRYQP